MKKLDWYIVKKFLVTFFFSIILFALISVVIDVVEKMENFTKSGWTLSEIIFNYYVAFVPHIVALLFPLFIFIAVIFFTSKMAARAEIVAILASGVSFKRFLLPYLATSIILAILLLGASAHYIPKAETKRTYFEQHFVDANSNYYQATKKMPSLYFKIDSHNYTGIQDFDTATNKGSTIFFFKIKDGKVIENYRATGFNWDTTGMSKSKEKGKWTYDNLFERKIDSIQERIVIQSKSRPKLNLLPSDMIYDDYARNKMTNAELSRYIVLEKQRGGDNVKIYQIELYRRYATAFSVIILSLIGAIIASKKVRGGSGIHLAIGLILAASYVIMDKFSTVFSTNANMPPLLAAWTPNIIFCFIAVYLYKKAPK